MGALGHPRRQAIARAAYGLVLMSFGVHSQGSSDIVAVRVWAHRDYTRVTIESERALQTTHTVVANPPRLALDLMGVQLGEQLKDLIAKVQPNDPYIADVRVGQFNPTTVRIVLDLKVDAAPDVFNLPPIAGFYKHRLVLDIHAKQEGDKLGDLIAQMQSKPASEQTKPASEHTKPTAPSGITPNQPVKRLVVIALDPGHGGEDPGAIGPKGTREKDIVLSIAKLVQSRLNDPVDLPPQLSKALSGLALKAFLTRDADYFVPLATRVEKAERARADLFISIHADAFTVPSAKGASVFALSEKGASSVSAKWLANKENQSDAIGGTHLKRKDKAVTQALLDMGTTAQIKDSLKVGSAVLGEFGQIGNLHKARVEQASFAVLKAPQIPSVLVETAFISNPEEEQRLRDPRFQSRIADALVRGIHAYFAKHPPLAPLAKKST